MASTDITALIRTIGRDSLPTAIDCAKREFGKVIVVADRKDLDPSMIVDGVIYLRNDEVIDYHGGAGINLGAEHVETEFFCLLDDDDEYVLGAGDFMQQTINSRPDIDIWIPGLLYNDGAVVCMANSTYPGNVAVPTYRTNVFLEHPFKKLDEGLDHAFTDYFHVKKIEDAGHKVGWYQNVIYLVRPKLQGRFGGGSL